MAAKAKSTTPKAPSVSQVAGSKTRRKSGSRKRASGGGTSLQLKSRIARALGLSPTSRLGQAVETAVYVTEVAGTGAVASALSGYREAQGKALKLGPVDLRVASGLGFLTHALWNTSKVNPDTLAIGTGLIGSWSHERAFEAGFNRGKPEASAPTTSGAGDNIVLGNVEDEDETGGPLRRLKRLKKREDRIEAKIDKIKGRLQRKGKLTDYGAPGKPGLPQSTSSVVYVKRGARLDRDWAIRHPAKARAIRQGARIQYV